MQCAALTRAGPVVGRPQSAASQPAARSSARSSVQQQQQRRRSLCRAQKVEEKGDNLAALGDNYESDLEPKPYTLPINSDELKQALKDFKYDGSLLIPMFAISAALAWLASVFPGHA